VSLSGSGWCIHVGDCREVLQALPAGSVHCCGCVTSPPYWGLRDYGCDGQMGLEQTPEEYVAGMVEVFRAVRRVLRDDGTLWLNLGDSYNSNQARSGIAVGDGWRGSDTETLNSNEQRRAHTSTLKPKDLVGIPWRVAFALQADGWWLRSDIIWAKPNPMPESVTDRPTKAHEYLFLLSKAARYFYDADGIGEPIQPSSMARFASAHDGEADSTKHQVLGGTYARPVKDILAGQRGNTRRNRRSWWPITTKPFPGAHFAVMPPELVEPCILAGTSERGCCGECGAPFVRVVERTPMEIRRSGRGDALGRFGATASSGTMTAPPTSTTIGWEQTCGCGCGPIPCTVLDPFAGAGTVGVVARQKGREFVGIELNPTYAEMAALRIEGDAPLFNRKAEGDAS